MRSSIRPLSKALQLIAEKELNEVPERIPEDLQRFKEWILSQPHLKVRMDDQFLIMFLRGAKYSLEKAKKKLDSFYTIRTTSPEWFANRDPLQPDTMSIIKREGLIPLNLESSSAIRILIGKSEVFDNCDLNDVFKVFHMICDILMIEDLNSTIAGIGFLFDLKNIPLNIIPQVTPSLIKRNLDLFQFSSPIRLKLLIFINVPPLLDVIISIVKHFLRDKMKNRFYVSRGSFDMSSFSDKIPKQLLPSEYNGGAGPIRKITEHWEMKIIEDYRNYLMEESSFGVDDSKRSTKRTIGNKVEFGIDGSFRKLNVD